MPLKLTLSKGEKLIVNGAVIKSDGDAANLVFENQAHILRERDILTHGEVQTPASRVHMALQCAYLFPERRMAHLDDFRKLLDDYVKAAPSAMEIAREVDTKVAANRLYDGLKTCKRLLNHEHEVLSHVH